MFSDTKQVMADKAKNAYRSIKEAARSLSTDPDAKFVWDIISAVDSFLRDAMIKIGRASDRLSEEERMFCRNVLASELDTLIDPEMLEDMAIFANMLNDRDDIKAYSRIEDVQKFLDMLEIQNPALKDNVVKNIEKILILAAAIDDTFSEKENRIIVEIMGILEGKNVKKQETVKAEKKADSKAQLQPQDLAQEQPALKHGAAQKPIENQTESKLQKALAELDTLVGLGSVKQEVHAVINLLKVNQLRKQRGMPELQTSNHMVFTGQPGTGKTTVARIMAEIFRELGVVSKGHLVETDRAGMVAGYVGQTAIKTSGVIEKAKGGVLFIDEAYSLSSEKGGNDYGSEAIDTLVKGMEDNRDDLVVIAAGYTDEMQTFIEMNPGLKSRFNKYIHFDNYSAQEMLEILKKQCLKAQFVLDAGAETKALMYFQRHEGDELFGNARGVRNYFDRAATKQASRIVSMPSFSDAEFSTITAADVE